MGRDKAWLNVDGVPLIQRSLATAREAGAREVFLSGRPGVDYAALGCPVLLDLKPSCGPLGGIEGGLLAATAPLLLVVAVDMAHLTAGFLQKLLAACDPHTGVVPQLHGAWEPLAAVYPKRAHAVAADFLAKSRHAVREFASACHRLGMVRRLEVAAEDAACLANWNCPTDITKPAATRSASVRPPHAKQRPPRAMLRPTRGPSRDAPWLRPNTSRWGRTAHPSL
jgi:molybdopterin-guanine dinucleotide biosynthesis protein A